MKLLILGSGPSATQCRDWPSMPFDAVLAINNAWAVHPGWTHAIYPEDFPKHRHPPRDHRPHIQADAYVPAQNVFGGFVYAGGTMAFTAAYWALQALRPRQMAFLGCDMVYPASGKTHFYGTGTADPLRDDPTLQSLEAKATRLMILAARAGCACTRLGTGDTRLTFPAAAPDLTPPVIRYDQTAADTALDREATLGYMVASGRYWEHPDAYDPDQLRALDHLWLAALPHGHPAHRGQ